MISVDKNVVKKSLVIFSAGAVLLLSACGTPTAAFTVGEKSTSVKEVQTSVDNIVAARKQVDTTGMNLQTGAALVEGQVQFLLISQLLVDTAKSVGITVSAAEVAAEKAGAIKQIGGEKLLPKALVGAGIDPERVDEYFTSVVYSQKLSAYVQKSGVSASNVGAALTKMVSDLSAKEGVKVNPRYGKWDPKTATLVPADAGSGSVITK